MKNYRYFIALLIMVLIACLYQFVIGAILLATFHIYDYDEKLANFYNCDENTIMIVGYVLLSITITTQLLIVVYLIDLLLLHKWLNKVDLTTFEYITFLKEKITNPGLELNAKEIKKAHKSKIIRQINNFHYNQYEERKTTIRGKLSIEINEESSKDSNDRYFSL